MKQAKFVLGIFLMTLTINAQKIATNEYASIDKLALQMPDSLTKTVQGIAGYMNSKFSRENEKIRGIFIWIATNIQYDMDNMFAINFYEKNEDKIVKALTTRKGICGNFACLFNAVCMQAGLRSYLIEGYTKQNGFADYIPHAWCSAFVEGAWFMFDPTWASGYVSNGKFYKKINNEYFKVKPALFIKSHMPFDFLWEFLDNPVYNQEFYDGKTQPDQSKPIFNFQDSIQAYEKETYIEQLTATASRIERNGVKNSLIFDRLQHIKLEIEQDRQNKIVQLFNAAVADYNEGVNDLNDFIQYRNKQFTPSKTDAEIQGMIDTASHKLKSARTKLGDIKEPDTNISATMVQLSKSIDDATTHVKEQDDWLKVYFSKGKSGRKSMFYDKKTTLFGIPLN
jgi:Transglutaminase-like superfamily